MIDTNQIIQNNTIPESKLSKKLLDNIISHIESAKSHVASYTNSTLVLLYWNVGLLINNEILSGSRAEYGEQILSHLAKELTLLYGNGFDRPNLSRMVKFSKLYSKEICVTLSQQLSWSHVIRLIAIEEELKRNFYAEMCRLERWSVRVLRQKIDNMLFERSAIAKKPESIIKTEIGKLQSGNLNNPDLYLQDPYILNFLKFKKISSESDLEQAILDELQLFIQELGSDFCFVARQKRMSTENNDRYLDLLFFHRAMRRLIAIELKMTSFQPEHAGQMEWYLKWLDKYERRSNEEKPLGIIICAGKDQEDIELLELDKNGIHVAEYLTSLPPKDLIEYKLKQVLSIARENYHKKLIDKQ
ncbi:YhcG family protein [Rickettsia endosymbiont of Rhinocyllus conicus]|uniref:PDDEXK nuclease domain-containing protein n=1 Tax=Rickettsia endosymbiont of Rhinocyllus conicus TaxID=3066252 RepID=UPI00313320B1